MEIAVKSDYTGPQNNITGFFEFSHSRHSFEYVSFLFGYGHFVSSFDVYNSFHQRSKVLRSRPRYLSIRLLCNVIFYLFPLLKSSQITSTTSSS